MITHDSHDFFIKAIPDNQENHGSKSNEEHEGHEVFFLHYLHGFMVIITHPTLRKNNEGLECACNRKCSYEP